VKEEIDKGNVEKYTKLCTGERKLILSFSVVLREERVFGEKSFKP
jgi:hypothetical protein